MKISFFRVFFLMLFINGSTFSENDSVEKSIATETENSTQRLIIPSDRASKGAIIEGIFILQNKKNSLIRHLRRVKIALLEIDHLIKDLVHERQILFDHFHRNRMSSNGSNMIDRILADLSVFYGEILNINLIKGIYPNYLKQIQQFVDDINNVIDKLVNGDLQISFSDLKIKIDKFDNILDIIEKEEQLIKLILEAENLKLSYKKIKDRIDSRHSQMQLYENSVKDKDDILYIDQKDLIEGCLKRLKKNMSKIVGDLESKHDKIKSLKQGLMKNYNEHQVFNTKLCSEILTDNEQLKFKLNKTDSLCWFIDSLEDIRKNINRNFNLED